jgi:Kef-type K+ transport system membrane component KefB
MPRRDARVDAPEATPLSAPADSSIDGGDRGDGGDAGDAGANALDDADTIDALAESADAGSDAAPPAPSVTDVPPPPTVAETRPAPVPAAARGKLAIRAILGLLALLGFAYIANHPRARRIEDALGIKSAIAAGFPFVALGLAARHPAVGVLSDDVLLGLTPLVEFGLGWLGFLVGFRLDLRLLDRLPSGAAVVISLGAAIPFFSIAVASGAALLVMGVAWGDSLLLRSGIVLGTAGAMIAPAAIHATRDGPGRNPLAQYLDEIVGIACLAVLAAYFRPEGVESQWALPGTVWLFVTLGMGATIGMVLYLILRRPASDAEFIAIVLGSVAFAAGMAAYVRLSPLVICFVAGVVIANLPSLRRDALGRTLERLERPIFLVFLALAGAIWDPRDLRGWALMPVFVASRYVGLWLGLRLARRHQPDAAARIRPRPILVAPLSVVAIAVVVNVQTLYQGPTVPIMLTAVIGGALLAELIATLADRLAAPRTERR